ncbi:TPA: hypothetical protein R7370_000248 [Pseudomonas aeruginosa]|nr:hypothetical protein [Pseudomonas aeruginosa]
MNKANECTCPSGDGSLVHPCPAHPAVEQADVAAKLTFINGRPAMCGCQVEYSDGGGEYSDVIYVTLCAKHSGSAILDLVATNRIALTPEYEGQWHADLYLDREIPLAKVEGATPAEAVLALMSAERIDPEQESVEQAGGDERAAFEQWLEQHMSHHFSPELDLAKYEDSGEYRYNPAADYWKAWQARAALAQPSPALPPFAEKVLAKLRRFYDCAEDFESGGVDIGRHWLDLLTQLGLLNRVQRSPAFWEISQQGEDLLGMPQPSPAQAEQAEAERPEVAEVAFVLRNIGAMDAEDIDGDNVDLRFEDAEGRDTGCDVSIVEYAEKAADLFEQHDRIVGALRADRDSWAEQAEQRLADWDEMRKERDAALVRVEQQERTIAGMNEAHATLAGLYEAAQAQHSVPEGWKLVPVEPTEDVLEAIHNGGYVGDDQELRWFYQSILAAAPAPGGE